MNLFRVSATLIFISHCLAATIQLQPALSLNISQQLGTLSSDATNVSLSDLGADQLIDPRFSTAYLKGDKDLSDKSVFMTCLFVLNDLSKNDFQAMLPVPGRRWSNAKYGNVEINIITMTSGFEIRFAMWAVYAALLHARDGSSFTSGSMGLFWTDAPGQARRPIGRIFLDTVDGPHPWPPGIESSGTSTNSTNITNYSSTSISDPWTLPILPNVSDTSATFTDNAISSLSAGRSRSVRVEFEGPTLFKWGVFASIGAAYLRMASLQRSSPFVFPQRDSFGGNLNNADLQIKNWPVARTEAPYLEYGDMTYMLYNIPRYMYQINKFRAGSFVLLVDEQPLAEGTFTKSF